MGHPQLKKLDSGELEKHVKAAKRGEESSLSWLISATKDRLLRFTFFLSGDPALAQDLCQDTYLYAIEHLGDLDEPEAFPRWLFVIAKNRFLDHVKSPRNKRREPVESLDRLGKFQEGKDQELWLAITRAMEKLEADDRVVLLLIDLEGHTYKESAAILGLSEAAVNSRLYRARAAFHKVFFGS